MGCGMTLCSGSGQNALLDMTAKRLRNRPNEYCVPIMGCSSKRLLARRLRWLGHGMIGLHARSDSVAEEMGGDTLAASVLLTSHRAVSIKTPSLSEYIVLFSLLEDSEVLGIY